jgi:hypothetical protein
MIRIARKTRMARISTTTPMMHKTTKDVPVIHSTVDLLFQNDIEILLVFYNNFSLKT